MGRNIEFSDEKLNESAAYFPIAGLIIGSIGAISFYGLTLLVPAFVAMILAIALLVLVTGCFHEDGFADMCDGIGGGVDRSAALRIMKDSRLGTYGVSGLVLLFAVKLAVLTAFLSTPIVPDEAVVTVCVLLILAHSLSRLSAVVVILTSEYVRGEGVAKPVAVGVSPARRKVLAATGLVVCVWAGAMLGFWVLMGAVLG
ncbi:MAG: adenosylcobinamide-GDP ribazoletransferase, partial [Gammaproteobacteria bacterium]|nr:adenosylcobinamide-GDP ribazoletransferase [Gammaproteobacteria bacterium]